VESVTECRTTAKESSEYNIRMQKTILECRRLFGCSPTLYDTLSAVVLHCARIPTLYDALSDCLAVVLHCMTHFPL